jgi:hypothetical protein
MLKIRNLWLFLTHLSLIRTKGTGFIFLKIRSGVSESDVPGHDINLFIFLPKLCLQLNKISTYMSTDDTNKLCNY